MHFAGRHADKLVHAYALKAKSSSLAGIDTEFECDSVEVSQKDSDALSPGG